MNQPAISDVGHEVLVGVVYAHQRPEPIGPDEDEEQTPIEPPVDNPPIAPPDEVPDRPAPVPPVPPVEVPGSPDLPGHIISKGLQTGTGTGAANTLRNYSFH